MSPTRRVQFDSTDSSCVSIVRGKGSAESSARSSSIILRECSSREISSTSPRASRTSRMNAMRLVLSVVMVPAKAMEVPAMELLRRELAGLGLSR